MSLLCKSHHFIFNSGNHVNGYCLQLKKISLNRNTLIIISPGVIIPAIFKNPIGKGSAYFFNILTLQITQFIFNDENHVNGYCLQLKKISMLFFKHTDKENPPRFWYVNASAYKRRVYFKYYDYTT